jgi:hypothetical protein
MKKNPLSEDAAFDFFVTARHVPDWLEAQGLGSAAALFNQFVELRICRHLADGAKHFSATHAMHKQVQGLAKTPGTFQANAFQPDAFQTGGLEIELDPADQATLSVGPRINAIHFASQVIDILRKVVPERYGG